MDHLMYLYAAVVIIAAALAAIAVGAPRALWVKFSALVLAAFLMAIGYASLVDLLGKPKPADMEWAARTVPEATVIAATMEENRAIYLWLLLEDGVGPRAYALPWSLQSAKQLQRAMQQAEAEGTAVRIRRPFEASEDPDEPLFYAEPQPALPPKLPTG